MNITTFASKLVLLATSPSKQADNVYEVVCVELHSSNLRLLMYKYIFILNGNYGSCFRFAIVLVYRSYIHELGTQEV